MPVHGVGHVVASLRDLARYVDAPLGAASRHALQPTLASAKAFAKAAPFDDSSGTVAASLVIRKDSRRSRKLKQVYRVGPKPAKVRWKGRWRNPTRYAHLLEFGTSSRGRRGGGYQFPGAKKKPFLTPAYYATRGQVDARFRQRIGQEMEKRARRLRARQALKRGGK